MTHRKNPHRLGRCLIAGSLVLLVSGVVGSEQSQQPAGGADERPAAGAAQSQGDVQALLAKLDHAQRELDRARQRLNQSSSGLELDDTLDLAQQLVDQARAQLLGEPLPGGEPSPEQLQQSLQKLQESLDGSMRQVIERAGPESRALFGGGDSNELSLFEVPGEDRMQAMFAVAEKRLRDARAKIMASPRVDPLVLQKLDEAERALETSRREAIALGFLK